MQPKSPKGYTLIEVILVIVVIGILAAAVIPRSGRELLDRLNAYTSAHQIAADMRYARGLAITGARNHSVRFYPETPPYTEYKILDGIEQVGELKQISSEVTCNGDSNEFIFEPLGNATADGSLSLIVREYQYDVQVLSSTGRVIVQ